MTASRTRGSVTGYYKGWKIEATTVEMPCTICVSLDGLCTIVDTRYHSVALKDNGLDGMMIGNLHDSLAESMQEIQETIEETEEL